MLRCEPQRLVKVPGGQAGVARTNIPRKRDELICARLDRGGGIGGRCSPRIPQVGYSFIERLGPSIRTRTLPMTARLTSARRFVLHLQDWQIKHGAPMVHETNVVVLL